MKPETIQDLKAEANRLRDMVKLIDQLVSEAEGRVNGFHDEWAAKDASPEPPRIRTRKKLTQAGAAEQVFNTLHRPLTKSELIAEVRALDVAIGNEDSFGSMLSRSEKFSPLGDGTWYLARSLQTAGERARDPNLGL